MTDVKKNPQKVFRINLASHDSKKPADLDQFTAHSPSKFDYVPEAGKVDQEILAELYILYNDMKKKLLELENKSAKNSSPKSTQWELSNVLSTPEDEMRTFINRNPQDFVFMLRQMFTYMSGFNDQDKALEKTLENLVESDAQGYNFIVAELERNTHELKKVERFDREDL